MSDRRLAVVTGTTSGVGEAVARQLLERGWRVVGIARREATLRHERYGHIAVDLSDLTRLERDVEPRLSELLGEVGLRRVGLVNNAAHVGLLGPIANMDVAQLPAVLATNLVAPIWFMGQVVRVATSETSRFSPTSPEPSTRRCRSAPARRRVRRCPPSTCSSGLPRNGDWSRRRNRRGKSPTFS